MARQVIERQILSGSTNGKRIKVVATATAGTLIHTAVNVAGQIDWVTLYAQNSDTVDRLLTIEYGGVAAPDDLIQQTITAKAGDVLVIASLPLNGGVVLRAFAAAASVITVAGFVERSTLE